jgi:hypothetical protein
MPEHGDVSVRSMLMLGGASSVAAVAVLGLTLVVGHGAGRHDRAPDPAPLGAAAQGPSATVPPTAGLQVMTAVNRLAVRRIPLGGVIRVPSSRRAGLVVRSYPPGGAVVREGSPVTLYVSAGTGGSVTGTQVTVPYLVGLDEPRARATAAGLGLRVVVRAPGGGVAEQQPAPGSVRPRGSTVTLTLR